MMGTQKLAGTPMNVSPSLSRSSDGSRLNWPDRVQDYRRHITDLQTRSYEGAIERSEREAVFLKAFDFTTPVAQRVLEDLSQVFLKGTGQFAVHPPERIPNEGGLLGRWTLDWPQLRTARSRFTGEPLAPVTLKAIYPIMATGTMQWTHPHLALLRPEVTHRMAAAWPFNVLSAEDAERQEPILRVLAEAEMHERTYEADVNWRVLTFALDESS
jgi:hypothetical protein